MDIIADDLQEYLKVLEKSGIVLPTSSELLCQLLTGAFIQSVQWWLSHKDHLTKYEMAEQMKNFVLNAVGLSKA